MSNNQEWYDDDDDDFGTEDDSTDLVKKLRRAARANEKRAKELETELQTLRSEQRKSTVKSVLESMGVRASIAKYIPSDIDPTAEAIQEWVFENGEDFGIVVQNDEPRNEATLAELRQMDNLTAGAISPAGLDDMMLRINQAQSAQEIEDLIFGS
jgi:hypothetical protein